MNNLIATLLISSQLFLLWGVSFRWSKELAVQLLIIGSLGSLIWKHNKAIALYIGWSLFLFFLFKSYTLNDFGEKPLLKLNPLAFFNMINIVLYGLFYYVLHQIKLDRDKIYKTFCFIAIFQAVFIILQKYQLGQFFMQTSAWVMGKGVGKKLCWPVAFWGNETLASWSLAICSPFFLAFKKFRFKLGYAITIFAIWCTDGRVAMAATLFGLLFWLFNNKKRYSKIIAITLIIGMMSGGFILYRAGRLDTYDPHRIQVWKKAWVISKTNRLTGFGLGSFRSIFHKRAPEFRHDGHWAQAHNDWLQLIFEQGLIGFGIVLFLCWGILYTFIKKRKGLIPLICLMISGIVAIYGFPFHTAIGVLPIVALVLFDKENMEK